jgi:asparagine synthase (glutamine-hydrolysing)
VSGFAAIAGPLSSPERNWLVQAAQFMAFRGPDALETWDDGVVGLAGALLAAKPLAEQPVLAALDGSFWICGDIRLDRREELQDRLAERFPPGATDLAIVLQAYRRWGDRCLEYLSGDFSFLLWDKPRGRLFGARDYPGISQLYYTQTGEHWLFGNTYEAFFLHPAVSDDLNEVALGDFLVQGHNQDHDTTAFSRIQRVPPGYAIAWSSGSTRVWKYRSTTLAPELARLPFASDYPDRFRELLTRAVEDRITAGPKSIHLSGGMDSSSVAATATKLSGAGDRITALTIVLDDVIDNQEGEYSRQVAEALGIEQEVIRAESYRPRDPLVPEFVGPGPVPFLPTRVQYDLISRSAAVGRQTLTGHGGDVALEFRPSYWIEWLVTGRISRLATVVAEHLRLYGRPPSLLARSAWTTFRRREGSVIPPWISESFRHRTRLRERSMIAGSPWRPHPDAGRYLGSSFWSDVLAWHDPAFTRLPIRFRHPFFDLQLQEFAASLPPMPWLHRKAVLRLAMRGALPEVVRTRRKTVLGRRESGSERIDHHPNLPELLTGKAERFFDCQRLRSACRQAETTSWGMDREFMNSLGLAYWLYHWRRPPQTGQPGLPPAGHPEPESRR